MKTDIMTRIRELCREEVTIFLQMVADYQKLLAKLNRDLETFTGPFYVSLPHAYAEFTIMMNFIKAFEVAPVTPEAIEQVFNDIRPAMNQTEIDRYHELQMAIDVEYVRMQEARDNMTSELEYQ